MRNFALLAIFAGALGTSGCFMAPEAPQGPFSTTATPDAGPDVDSPRPDAAPDAEFDAGPDAATPDAEPTTPDATPAPDAAVPECTEDDDCEDGESCADGTCQSAPPAPDCADDTDCADGQVCIEGVCLADGQRACDEDIDCAGREVCVDRVCTPRCERSTDCVDGDTCTVDRCDVASGRCAYSQRCAEGETCQQDPDDVNGDNRRWSCEGPVACGEGTLLNEETHTCEALPRAGECAVDGFVSCGQFSLEDGRTVSGIGTCIRGELTLNPAHVCDEVGGANAVCRNQAPVGSDLDEVGCLNAATESWSGMPD